jgi:hypothetical protein
MEQLGDELKNKVGQMFTEDMIRTVKIRAANPVCEICEIFWVETRMFYLMSS